MKPTNTKHFDESDYVTLKAQLSLHAAMLRGLCHQSDGVLVAPPQLSIDRDIVADVGTLEAHVAELQSRLGGIAPAFQPASTPAADGETYLQNISRRGKGPGKNPSCYFNDAPNDGPVVAEVKRQLAEHGCSSIPELNAKLACDTAKAALDKAANRKGIHLDCLVALHNRAAAKLATFRK